MAANDRSFGELLTDITRDMSKLFREEVALAKREIQQTISTAIKDVVMVAVGGFILYAGALVLIAAAVIALALVVDLWLSALIIGGAITLIGLIVLMIGIQQLRSLSPMPERAASNVTKDVKTIREKVK